ncbi:hypothetical protein [Lysinibacillus pakistanensis]|uniref:Uncharacterized protein n=1 Tax=Lysinibacillus pakistanensis TaxID=759811 RepID=A0AAX3WS56_9BACI|nr:hypothetical protein [Lysinibacillus pakistanensis]MDM5229990.1 hypothetical protein [Lysinibacillus pakistanensis]WHY45589.1 hypothetical protein QNH22_20070 [Lysinibacillus pakistanensis]WHY50597.1 hypothetical protein QNH24_20035 [Lysinibacillus pakistanensis]
MKKLKFIYLLIFSLFVLIGCADKNKDINVSVSKKPDAQEVLSLDTNADIFQWNDIIYQTNIDWINELQLTENLKVGKIEANSSNAAEFKNGTANMLSVGTEIFTVKERNDVLMVKDGGELKFYYLLAEG